MDPRGTRWCRQGSVSGATPRLCRDPSLPSKGSRGGSAASASTLSYVRHAGNVPVTHRLVEDCTLASTFVSKCGIRSLASSESTRDTPVRHGGKCILGSMELFARCSTGQCPGSGLAGQRSRPAVTSPPTTTGSWSTHGTHVRHGESAVRVESASQLAFRQHSKSKYDTEESAARVASD